MEYNNVFNKCNIEGCENKKQTIGLCQSHYNKHIRSGHIAGVYKINLKDKTYIGMSNSSLKDRLSTEKSGLIMNDGRRVSNELLEYFNYLCSNEKELSKEEVLKKYFSYEIIFGTERWSKVDENFNEVEYEDNKQKRDLIFKALTSTNPEIQEWNKKLERLVKHKEHYWIRYFKELDKKNNTNNCLNKKD